MDHVGRSGIIPDRPTLFPPGERGAFTGHHQREREAAGAEPFAASTG